MSEQPQEQIDLVVGALDSLGVALADHGHEWTDGERAIYEESIKTLWNIADEWKQLRQQLAAEREKGRQEGYSEGWHRAVEELTAEAAKECGVDLYQGDAEYLERTKAEWLKQFNANKESG